MRILPRVVQKIMHEKIRADRTRIFSYAGVVDPSCMCPGAFLHFGVIAFSRLQREMDRPTTII
jgi:hypothetical protein